ncbi:MAG: hypothetical protein ACKVOH_04410 [Chlamydiales bacterium]
MFRKYQKGIFLVTTLMIVTSFVFFGTYQAFAPSNRGSDPVVYKTESGEKIHQSLLTNMTQFLRSERSPFPSARGIFDTNYLNDGILTKEFIESGLSQKMVEANPTRYQEVLQAKIERERHFKPFVHSFAPMLSAEAIWTLFAPDIKENLVQLQAASDGIGSFATRSQLFLAEKRFPPPLLAQMIRYQGQEYSQLPPDQKLYREEVSLFGYHNLEEWFSAEFVEDAAKVILEVAAIAKKKGYQVHRDEVAAEIYYKTGMLYESVKEEIQGEVTGPRALFAHYLRMNGMEEENLMKICEATMLFRRLLDDVSEAALNDSLALQDFYTFAREHANVEVTTMPQALQFADIEAWKRFELYLYAVAGETNTLDLPSTMETIEKIERRAPELVGERYLLYVGHLERRSLEAKVSLQETWRWEEEHADELKERFSELHGDVIAQLESFPPKQRARIDAYARSQIVERHPEWIAEAFQELTMEKQPLFYYAGMESPFEGIADMDALAVRFIEDEITNYTQDGKHYYRILIDQRPEGKEVLALHEAGRALDALASRIDANGLIEAKRVAINRALGTSLSLEEAMPYRFYHHLQQGEGGIWPRETKQMTINRIEPNFISLDAALTIEPGTSSPVLVDEKVGAYTYRFLDHRVDATIPQEKVSQMQAILSKEVRYNYLHTLLEQIRV